MNMESTTYNYNPVSVICDEVVALLRREQMYCLNSCLKIPDAPQPASPCHHNEKKLRVSSPVSVAVDDSSYSDKESRGKVCDWMYRVVDHFELGRESVPKGMSCYDRYLAKFPTHDKEQYQLIAVTSLYIVVKLNENRRCTMLPLFSKLTSGRFSEKVIADMESRILFGLEWLVNPPSPQEFVYQFTSLLCRMHMVEGSCSSKRTISNEAAQIVMEAAIYITEVSLLSIELGSLESSRLGFASMLVVLKGAKNAILSPNEQGRFCSFLVSLVGPEKSYQIQSTANQIEEAMHTTENHVALEQMYQRLDPTGIVFVLDERYA